MKKYLLLLLVATAMAATFTACSKDNESFSTDPNIIGTWSSKFRKTWDGKKWEQSDMKIDANGICEETVTNATIDLNNNNIWINYTDTYRGKWKQVEPNKIAIKWETKEREITGFGKTIKEKDEDNVVIIYNISNNGKTLTFVLEDEPNDTPEVFTRKY
ncbi:hypothetical protein [Prevotella melaninogenica]|uniref:hypothetical protein n=1 Tax=Prevotella melaninogenica TaxID=28132 RepID=UPI001BAD9BB9|nr:hypothetical protein [Prevotella melaninogenica]QUB66080.1 hypothetical protein J5A57_03005 [Prevotella melaninogenica]